MCIRDSYTTWSVFRQPVQTNNDVEGWHCPLNDKASRGQLNLYKLIQLLYAQKLYLYSLTCACCLKAAHNAATAQVLCGIAQWSQ